jgi:hypothetical protein
MFFSKAASDTAMHRIEITHVGVMGLDEQQVGEITGLLSNRFLNHKNGTEDNHRKQLKTVKTVLIFPHLSGDYAS